MPSSARLTLEGLVNKLIGYWKGIAFKSWLLIRTLRHTMGESFRRPRISLGSWLSTWQTLLLWLMRSILGHASKILFDKDTQLLLTPKFRILPLYREFLYSARRIRTSPSSEKARGWTGLVLVICKENKEQKGKRKYHAGTPHPNDRGGFTQYFGSCSLMSTLYVWFPASWAPMVAERLFS